jgi:hypothetical protein
MVEIIIPFSDILVNFEIRSARGVLEARIQGKVLSVDWVEGPGMVFQMKQIQDAAGGAGAFNVRRGYAVEVLAENIKKPGYIDRLAQAVSARLGGAWTAKLEQEGVRTYVVSTRCGG